MENNTLQKASIDEVNIFVPVNYLVRGASVRIEPLRGKTLKDGNGWITDGRQKRFAVEREADFTQLIN